MTSEISTYLYAGVTLIAAFVYYLTFLLKEIFPHNSKMFNGFCDAWVADI